MSVEGKVLTHDDVTRRIEASGLLKRAMRQDFSYNGQIAFHYWWLKERVELWISGTEIKMIDSVSDDVFITFELEEWSKAVAKLTELLK